MISLFVCLCVCLYGITQQTLLPTDTYILSSQLCRSLAFSLSHNHGLMSPSVLPSFPTGPVPQYCISAVMHLFPSISSPISYLKIIPGPCFRPTSLQQTRLSQHIFSSSWLALLGKNKHMAVSYDFPAPARTEQERVMHSEFVSSV